MAISLKHSFTSAVSDGSTTWTGTLTSGSDQLTSVSPAPTSAIVGYRLYNANIPSGTTVVSVSGSTITMSANATGSASGATFYTDDKLVQASDWNAEHTLTLATNKLLGRSSAGAGAAEEITLGSGLSLSSGTLTVSTAVSAAIGYTINGQDNVIVTGVAGTGIRVPFACTIDSVTLLANTTGSIVIDIWKDTYANFPPTVADSICASAKPTITSGTKSEDTTLTGWTKTISAGDVLYFNVDSCSTITNCVLILKVTKS